MEEQKNKSKAEPKKDEPKVIFSIVVMENGSVIISENGSILTNIKAVEFSADGKTPPQYTLTKSLR